ncbi:hypothetical protein QYE76_000960 [Lolium multiflorum]|uniref:Uncharacterized protein n=1 Tax=Lolium multiflorum TaxID=4521 RepID=A0AAD8RJS3_LOLMU|nr:hypothetical protein QYE76_000960 [Lolium multiflorum]
MDTPWAAWRSAEIGTGSIDVGPATSSGGHWAALRKLVPLYRCLTRVAVGDGCRTSFWHDDWLPGGPLSISVAALFSHTTSPEVTFAQVLTGGVDNILVPRLSRVGRRSWSRSAPPSQVSLVDGADVAPSFAAPALGTSWSPALSIGSATFADWLHQCGFHLEKPLAV